MEELSQYRSRIGIFSAIYCRKSFAGKGRKRQKRSQSPSLLKRKLMKAKNKPKDTAHIPQKAGNCLKYERRPCRLGYLILLLIIAVTCLSERPKYFPPVSHDTLKDRSWIVNNQANNSNSICIRKLHWQQRNVQFEKMSSSSHWSYFKTYRETKIWTPAIPTVNVLSFIHKRYRLFQTPKHDFAPTETCHNASVSNTRSLDDNQISSTYLNHAIEILNCDKGGTLQNFTSNDYSTTICSNLCMKCHIIIILICLELLLCFGTCYYLLGNKGSHSYHGNPVGDAWLNKKTLALIEEHAHESIGAICIKTFPHGEKYEPFRNYGTGFRAGDKYFITAYHVLREKIECIILEVCMQIDNEDKRCAVHRILSQKLGETVDDTLDISKVVKKYIVHTHTNVPLLLETLKDVLDIDNLNKQMNQTWKQRCEVNFINHGKFFLDWKIVFGDADSDIVVVKLTESPTGQSFPRPLLLDEKLRQLNDIHVIRYKFDDTPVVGIDQSTQTFNTDVDLQNEVEAAIKWWNDKYPNIEENYFHSSYESCRKLYDEETGKVVLKASQSFKHGASGSPIVYLFNRDGQPVVGMIYQRGLPEFYYTDLQKDPRCQRFGDIPVNSVCLFEGGTAMKQLAKLLDRAGNITLRRNLFSQPQNMETHVVGSESDSWLNETTLALIEEHAQESVGSVCTKSFSRGKKYEPFKNYGTGFRAGDKYFITAYHHFKDKIENIISEVCMLISDNEDKKCAIYRTLSRKLDETVDDERTEFSASDISKIVNKFVQHTYTDVPLLLTTLEGVLDTDNLKSQLNRRWKQECEVNFKNHGMFFLDWKIAFGDEDSDIVVIKLTESPTGKKYPRPLLLDENFRRIKNIHIIRYTNDDTSVVGLDQSTQTINTDVDLQNKVDAAIKWWNDKYPNMEENYFHSSYESCKKLYDEETGKVVLKASQSFKHGASGSPIVYLFNRDGQPVVGMIYQRGLPEFYYTDLQKDPRCQRFGDIPVDSNICLFESGTAMKQLAKLLDTSGNIILRRNLFSQPENIETHVVEIEELKKLQFQIHNMQEDLGDRMSALEHSVREITTSKRPKDLENRMSKMEHSLRDLATSNRSDFGGYMMHSADSEKLSTMIEQATVQVDYETSQNVYVRTKAYDKAEEILNDSNIVVIIGNPGDGKTALAFQLMKSLCSVEVKHNRRLRPLVLSEGYQFDELVKPNKCLCVLIDDMFDLAKFSPWNRRLGQLFSAFQDTKDRQSNKLIVTQRKDIFNACPDSTKESPLFSDNKILDLSSKHFMTREAVRAFFDVYVPESEDFNAFSNQELDEIMKNSPYIGFPQCCKLAKENKELKLRRKDFFENPVEFLKREFQKMTSNDENIHRYVSLVFLLFNPLYLSSQIGKQKANCLTDFLHEMYGYQWKGKDKLLESLREMTGLYTKYDDDMKFSFSHDSILTSFASTFGTKHINEYIQYADPLHLSLLVTDNIATQRNGSIIVPKHAMSYLIKRVTEHLMTRKEETFKYISNMQVWDDWTFVLDMIEIQENSPLSMRYVNESNRSMLVYFAERGKEMPVTNIIKLISDDSINKDQINLGLNAACATGNEEIALLLLSTKPEPDIYYFINAVKGRNIKILSLLLDTFPTTIEKERAMEQHYSFLCPSAITALHQACHEGNCSMVKLICSKFPSLATVTNTLGHTPLHTSSYKGHTDICHYLITNFPELLHMQFTGILPIHLAAQSGNIQCFDLIENHISDVYPDVDQYIKTAITESNYTVFHAACLSGNNDMCLHISKKYPFIFEIYSDLALMTVAMSGSIECFRGIYEQYLQRKDKELQITDIRNFNGNTLLHNACANGKSEMCKYLISLQPSLMHITNSNGGHCLHAIAESGNVDLFKLMLTKVMEDKNKEDEQYLTNLVNNEGRTVLHFASTLGKQQMCKYIADTYPKLINIRRNDGVDVLHEAAWSGSISCLETITDIVVENKDPTQRQQYMMKCLDHVDSTIFHYASRNGQIQMCQYIAKTYSKLINLRRYNGVHILHEAAWSGSVQCLETITDIVVENQSPTERQQYMMKCLSNVGSTIFHIASSNGQIQMCQYIAKTYPKLINIKRNDGVHVLHEAARSGSIPCLETITDIVVENQNPTERQQYMMQCLDNVGSTIFHSASRNGQIQMCQYIAKTYPKLINIKRNDGVHVLHEAARSGSIPCLETITDIVVENQSPTERQQYMMKCLSNVGSTIFHIASSNGQIQMCQYIAKTYPKLINIKRNDGVHVLHEAARSGSIPCLETITDIVVENQNPTERQQYMMQCLDNVGSTIFHSASRNGQIQMCQYIAKTYPKLINIKRNDGVHVLHEAARSGSIPCLETITDIVVENQSPTERQQYMMKCLDNDGATIFHIASSNGQIQMCQYIAKTYPKLINIKRNDGVHVLHEAARSGSIPCLETITDIVVENQSPTERQQYMMKCLDNDGATIFHIASSNGQIQMCQYIAKTYPKLINIKRNDGVHVLHAAAWSGSIQCLETITDIVVENQSPTERQQYMMKCLDNKGLTIFHYASSNGQIQMCQYIAKTYPKLINIKRNDGVHVLHEAAGSGSIPCLETITDIVVENQNPTERQQYMMQCLDNVGSTIFHYALSNGQIQMCQYIAKIYPKLINIKRNDGVHVLHEAAWSGSIPCLETITDIVVENQNPTERQQYMMQCLDNVGSTIFHSASRNGKIQMCQYIAKTYPKLINIKRNDGVHVLHEAAWSGSIQCLETITDIVVENQDPTERQQYMMKCLDNDGLTIFHYASSNGQIQMCQYIAERYPKLINIRTNGGMHVLHKAAGSGSIPCLETITDIVVENQSPTERQQYMMQCLDNVGSTIFHSASRNGKIQMCQYIAKTYPKLINIKRNDGVHVLHEAAWSGSIPCLETITDIVLENQSPTERQQYMMQCLENVGSTIFHSASRNGQIQMCQYIAKTYPKLINIKRNDGVHVLHEAARSGSIQCLETITDIVLENQSPTERQQYMMQCLDYVGSTIFHSASRNGQIQMCQYIAKTYPKLINIKRNDGVDVLHEAARSGSIPCLETITDIVVENQDPTERQQYMMQCLDYVGSTIFHSASRNGQIQMCQYIAKTYPKLINIKRNDGVDVLHEAARSGSIQCLETITDIVVENQDPTQREQYMMQCLSNVGSTIFHFASRNGQVQMCQYIAKTYPKLINIKRNDGVHVLHEAAWSGSIQCLETITDIVVEDQDPTQRQQYMMQCLDNDNATILHFGHKNEQLKICQYINNTYPNLRRNMTSGQKCDLL